MLQTFILINVEETTAVHNNTIQHICNMTMLRMTTTTNYKDDNCAHDDDDGDKDDDDAAE